MKWKFLKFSGVLFCVILVFACASLNVNLNSPLESSLHGKRVLVIPFQEPYYKGKQLQGIGSPFAAIFVNKLLATGISSNLVKVNTFPSTAEIEIEKACKYATDNGYDMLITGIITEWVDGATQWSGTVDVAALSVNVYASEGCKLIGSASGKQTGTLFTFINAPATRFFEPLSETIIATLLGQTTLGK